MPRTKLSSTNTSSATATTLNDLSTPSTSPLVPSPSLPLTALTSTLTLKTPNQQHVHDSTLSLPIGTTLTVPRKNGSRIGQSILGQLLAAHKPGRDHHKLAHDATLSLETIRPKEQQRRSILPSSWSVFQKSTSIQGLSMAPSHSVMQHSGTKMVPGSTSGSNRNVMENLDQNEQPMLPSVWLESVLSQLSRSESNTLSHYATLPRVDSHERRQPALQPMFNDLDQQPKDKKKNDKTNATRLRSALSHSALSSKSKSAAKLNVKPQTLTRRGSACELALGEDARELFQQNRPKTLSSAIITSSIVPVKDARDVMDSPKNSRQRSLDSSVAMKVPTQSPNTPELAPEPPAQSGTTTTTRGRFIIESSSSSSTPNPRTRTLSCAAAASSIPMLTGHLSVPTEKPPTMSPEKSFLSKPPSPTRSFSLPPPTLESVNRIPPPSPSLSPSRFTVHDSSLNGQGSSSTSNPILIPRPTKPNHQRTQSNSSTQSSASASSSRRSQVIIPPPVCTSSLQFASFASIAPNVSPTSRRAIQNNNNKNNKNNFRNLSIQIVDSPDKCDAGLDSHDSQVFHLDTPAIHPLDEDASARRESYGARSEMQIAHQTMNRVHPHQGLTDNSGDCAPPLTACSTSCSSVSSMSSSLGNYGNGSRIVGQYGSDQSYHGCDRNPPGIGYLRQRSLSAANFDSHHVPQRSPSHGNLQVQQQEGTWSERPTRRSHGSVSSSEHCSNGMPIKGMSENKSGPSVSSSYGGGVSDIVIKKSATGRMFTVERTIPASPTKSSRFTLVTSPTLPPRSPSPLQK
ncbi:hypothetical protein BGZ80_010828 [Entomortierella chlamydospora]|uniref:Uncharacterized protein n=1 Tax=Entomortierella chlamydospora TaxID=101097 RepID=A0A9P6N780_9FUNG|nr:hypothetical protein BGZ80_010828 [Entomortierella chlamydospora]